MPAKEVRVKSGCYLAALCLAALLLAGCSDTPAPDSTLVMRTLAPSASASPSPTATNTPDPSPTPSATRTPTLSRTPTVTPTATPTPTPPHPLDVEAMRRATYPGSDLVFEQTLDPGSNYERYIVSYLSEGLTIYAYMTVPREQKPASGWPVILFNHGYIPPEQYRSAERYVAYVDAFARNGYIVLRSDYRGHGLSEGEPSGSGASPDYTIDVLNALASIKRYPDADPGRSGMWGHSMGGGITLRCMVVTDDIKAGVIWAGMVASYPDLLGFYMRTPAPGAPTPQATRRWAQEMLTRYGTAAENPNFWAVISANSYVAELSGPVQIHHGTADQSVPLEYSLMLERQIVAAGRLVELYLYEGDDHNIAQNWGTAMTRSVVFMDRWVKGE
jgi:dipeptidyl aminopeptidase/acylaminoacyl peptidase